MYFSIIGVHIKQSIKIYILIQKGVSCFARLNGAFFAASGMNESDYLQRKDKGFCA